MERVIISLYKGKDDPFRVDPSMVTHAFMLVPSHVQPNVGQDLKCLIDKVLIGINPSLWPIILQIASESTNSVANGQ